MLSKIERGKSVVLDNIFFAFDSFELDPKSDNEIDRLVSFLKDNPSVAIEIVGHTDNIGSEKRNRVLSENRALSVKKALVAKGIDPSSYSSYSPARNHTSARTTTRSPTRT